MLQLLSPSLSIAEAVDPVEEASELIEESAVVEAEDTAEEETEVAEEVVEEEETVTEVDEASEEEDVDAERDVESEGDIPEASVEVEESVMKVEPLKVKTGFRFMQAYADWPNPGSIRLDKKATSTGKYAEWEVNLTVEGKNVSSTSDIIIVFDRSNSMYGTRATKAKNAARDFVNTLLSNPNSNVRIAIVPFGTSSNTTNDKITGFQGYNGKNTLLNAINAIEIYSSHTSGGTNIQKGLMEAEKLMNQSTAAQKTIVLMSDGEPTYSQKATSAQAYQWPYVPGTGINYNFILSNFNNTRVGSGSSYNLNWLSSYSVSGYTVDNNGIPTISTAQHIMNKGIDMYSIGLEVGNVPNAIYVLRQSQNKGYYAGGQDDISTIFQEVAASISSAATNAITIDPLGDMFNLVKDGSYNGENMQVSHGTITWDDQTETFTWDMGNIHEGQVYTLTYKVELDFTKNPQGFTDYPTNKRTTLDYEDYNKVDRTKDYPIPEVQIESGRIDRIGYRVNVDGEPVDANGNVVNSIMEAERFYMDTFGDDLMFNETYAVTPGNTPANYYLHTGDDPTNVTLTPDHVYELVAFGYIHESEVQAGDVIVKYVDEAGNEIAPEERLTGTIGADYTSVKKDIDRYIFVKMADDSALPEGQFTASEQTVIYVYKEQTGTIEIIKEDEQTRAKLSGAIFVVKNEAGEVVAEIETDENGVGQSEPLPIGNYTIEEVVAPTGYVLPEDMQLGVTVKADKTTKRTITNTPIQGEITIYKVDADDDTLLAGARFELRDEANQAIQTETTDENGVLTFENVHIGTYTIVETVAPEGYTLLAKPVTVEITADSFIVEQTITNKKQGWVIPDTGGSGTIGFYSFGFLLLSLALGMWLRRKTI